MIDKSDKTGVHVYIGDGDVLMGLTTVANLTRIWFAPRPPDCPLQVGEIVKADTREPPPDTATTLYFMDREGLERLIEMLQIGLNKSFPQTQENET